MTYTALVEIALVASVLTDLALLRTKLVTSLGFWIAYAILTGFQLVVNGLLTGLRVVRYDPGVIIGIRIAFAPIEDLGFGFALILLTLSCWTAVERRN